MQWVRAENPAAYFRGMLSLVQQDVRLAGHSSQMPFETPSMSVTMALLNRITSKCGGSRVNDDSGELHTKALTKNNSATSA
jgi:hypothetical protein